MSGKAWYTPSRSVFRHRGSSNNHLKRSWDKQAMSISAPCRLSSTSISAPRIECCTLPPRDAAGHQAFGDIAAGEIKVPEAAAELTGRIEARDRRAARSEDLLLRVVNRAALRVGDRRPDF